MRRSYLLAMPLMLGVISCNSNTTADEKTAAADPQATATATPAAVGTTGAVAQLPLTAQAFVDAAAGSDWFEIESSRIMQGAGPAQPLTAYTQMMLRDHQASSNKLKKAANDAKATPDQQKMTAEQKANLDALREAGPEMAKLYLSQQVAAHEKTLAVLQNYAASGDNQALMAYASQAVPIVTHHLAEAKKLAAAAQ